MNSADGITFPDYFGEAYTFTVTDSDGNVPIYFTFSDPTINFSSNDVDLLSLQVNDYTATIVYDNYP